MSNTGAIRAGQAYVEMYADGTRLEAGLKRAQARLRAFGQSLRQAGATMALSGAAMLAPFVHAVKTFMDAAKDGKLAGADLGKAITLHQAVNTTTESIKQLEIAVAAALTPALVTMAGWLKQVVGSFTAWAKANPGTVTAIALVAGGVAALGVGLLGLGAAVNIASWAFGGLALAASSAFGVISGVVAAVLSPIGLVAAALAGLGYVLATETDAGRQSLDYLGQGFDQLADDSKAAWGGITDALASGDLGLAAQIGLKLVQIHFSRAWNFVKEITLGLLVGIQKGFIYAGEYIVKAFYYVTDTIRSLFGAVIQYVSKGLMYTFGALAVIGAAGAELVGYADDGTAQGVADSFGQTIFDSDQKYQADAGQSDKAFKQRMADVETQADEMRQALTDGLADVITENDGMIGTLREQLEALRTTAATGRKELEQQMQAKGDAATAAAAAVKGRAPKADVFGTFSSAATFGIGIGSTAADRTAKATEESAKELKAIREKIFTGQTATFAP